MTTQLVAANPFALMVDPAQVRAHIDSSEELGKLSQRQCHPLDRAGLSDESGYGRRPVWRSRAARRRSDQARARASS